MRMNVLVTGAGGFIGSALVKKLHADGHRVRAMGRSREKLDALKLDGVELMPGDITHPADLDRACAGMDVVYHIAGAFREPSISDKRYHEVNVQGTINALEAAKKHGVKRFVQCSTAGIHGSIKGPAPANEQHPLVIDNVYEQTKADGEIAALRYGREHGLDVTVVRPTQVYGPGDTRLLKLFKLVNKKRVLWFGPGTNHYGLLYIDDLVDGLMLAGVSDSAAGEAFLINGPESPTLNEMMGVVAAALGKTDNRVTRIPAGPVRWLGLLCEIVCRPLGVDPPIYRRRVDFFTNNRLYDITKARRVLGYEPKVRMAEGLRRTAEWYRHEGLLPSGRPGELASGKEALQS